jgi:hypothetical protein
MASTEDRAEERKRRLEAILSMPPAERQATEERLAAELIGRTFSAITSLIFETQNFLTNEIGAAPELKFRAAILGAATQRLNAAFAELAAMVGQARRDLEG